LRGKIIKIHSDFYYVLAEKQLFECKIREKLKKGRQEIFVGDEAEIETLQENLTQGVITKIFPRANYLPRPSIANVDLIIVVGAVSSSQFDFNQLNRYLCQAKLFNVPAIICINKSDLPETEEYKEKILEVYEKLKCKVVFTSALTGDGIENLIKLIRGKVSVLSGMSGVGKTSLLNKIHPELKLRTKQVSEKTGKGTHTTRHVEIMTIPHKSKPLQIADTPGFSHLRFDTVLPAKINELFDEIKKLSDKCKFSDCTHLSEEGCNVIANLEKISPERYESYKNFLAESFEYKEKLKKEGHKEEKSSKTIHKGKENTKQMVKLSTNARKKSRNTEKQKMNVVSILDEIYYNQDDES